MIDNKTLKNLKNMMLLMQEQQKELMNSIPKNSPLYSMMNEALDLSKKGDIEGIKEIMNKVKRVKDARKS